MLKTIIGRKSDNFIKRWPKSPKIVFFAAPNSFDNELVQRFSIDLGLPIISIETVFKNISEYAGKSEEYNHPFFLRAKEMIDAGDIDQQLADKLALKVLRLTNTGREGFILTDFPRITQEAELLEEFRGGMNSFVHLSLPDDIQVQIEENKLGCQHCGREYYPEDIRNNDLGIYIDKFIPKDGHCYDCGSLDIVKTGNAAKFEQELQNYRKQKDELLGFYDHLGLLVDFEVKQGYEDFDNLKDQIQFNIKH